MRIAQEANGTLLWARRGQVLADLCRRKSHWKLGVLCSYVLIGASALRSTFSTSGFLVLGLGTVLMLDRDVFRIFLPGGKLAVAQALASRALCFLTGFATFYCSAPSSTALSEAAICGVVVSLFVFVLELALGAAFFRLSRHRWTSRDGKVTWWAKLLTIGALVAAAVGISPMINLHLTRQKPNITPAHFGLAHEEVAFQASDGLTLAGWLIPAKQPRGNVIFCHGLGGNRAHVCSHLRELSRLGLNVLAFDFRGHGESPGHTITFGAREVADVLGADRYLRERFPDKPTLIVGISFGAAVTLQALPKLEDVAAAWVMAPFARLENALEHRLRFVPESLRSRLISVYSWLAWMDCGIRAEEIAPVDAIRGLKVPIHFTHGARDSVIPFAEAELLFTSYTGPKSRFWCGQSGHDVHDGPSKQEYFTRLARFVEENIGGMAKQLNVGSQAAGSALGRSSR